MRRRAPHSDSAEDQSTRFAWWASFCVTLLVVGLLSIAHAAQAAAPPSAPSLNPIADLSLEDEFGAEEEAEEDEDCIWDELEEELWCPGEEAEEEELEERDEADKCIVTSAAARVAARPGRDRLELTVRYRSERRAAVTIAWRLSGRRGKLNLGTERARFSRSGSFRHLETRLGERRMRRALAAREFRVEIRAVNTPRHCKHDLASRLSGRRSTAAGPYWFERAGRR